jgi:serine/threonine-protein kinase
VSRWSALPAQRERWINAANNEIAFLQSLEPWDERHIAPARQRVARLAGAGAGADGRDLGKHMIAARSNETVRWRRRWAGSQLNQALAKVHQYGWRYLDLKPANVLLDPHLRSVKLADFGTNRELGSLQAHSMPAPPTGRRRSSSSLPMAAATPPRAATIFRWARCCTFGGRAAVALRRLRTGVSRHHVAGADVLRPAWRRDSLRLLPEEEQRFTAAIPAEQRDAALACAARLAANRSRAAPGTPSRSAAPARRKA